MRYDRMYSWFVRLYIVFKKKKSVYMKSAYKINILLKIFLFGLNCKPSKTIYIYIYI